MISEAERVVIEARGVHEARPFPARLRDKEPDVVLCDAGLAGCVSYWLASRRLDPDRRALVDWTLATLSAVNERLSDPEERAFVQGLRDLALTLPR